MDTLDLLSRMDKMEEKADRILSILGKMAAQITEQKDYTMTDSEIIVYLRKNISLHRNQPCARIPIEDEKYGAVTFFLENRANITRGIVDDRSYLANSSDIPVYEIHQGTTTEDVLLKLLELNVISLADYEFVRQ